MKVFHSQTKKKQLLNVMNKKELSARNREVNRFAIITAALLRNRQWMAKKK